MSENIPAPDYCGTVDGVKVPIPHFGVVLNNAQFEEIQKSFETHEIEFVVKPHTRYENKTGEQRTMFVLDHSGNPLEFKAFKNEEEIFE